MKREAPAQTSNSAQSISLDPLRAIPMIPLYASCNFGYAPLQPSRLLYLLFLSSAWQPLPVVSQWLYPSPSLSQVPPVFAPSTGPEHTWRAAHARAPPLPAGSHAALCPRGRRRRGNKRPWNRRRPPPWLRWHQPDVTLAHIVGVHPLRPSKPAPRRPGDAACRYWRTRHCPQA